MPGHLDRHQNFRSPIILRRETKLIVKTPSAKPVLHILRNGNTPWHWQSLLCHHLLLFLFSSEGSLGSGGNDRCCAELSPGPSHPAGPTLSKGWVKGADVETDYFDRGLIFLPIPPKSLFSLMFGWIIPILNEKQRRTAQNYPGGHGETPGNKSTKGKSQRLSALKMVCSSALDTMIKEREMEGDVLYVKLCI